MEYAWPRNSPHAVLADCTVSKENAWEAHQPVVVECHDEGGVAIDGTQHGRGESWEEIMTMNHIGAELLEK
jgi:hypothetical protein